MTLSVNAHQIKVASSCISFESTEGFSSKVQENSIGHSFLVGTKKVSVYFV